MHNADNSSIDSGLLARGSSHPRVRRPVARLLLTVASLAWFGGCDGDGPRPVMDGDGGLADGGAASDLCADFPVPMRDAVEDCDDVDVEAPAALVRCGRGSGWAGRWAVDDFGLPAYDFQIDQRCDGAGQSYSPRRPPQRSPLRDPLHLIGNGRGLVAVAHASGSVEVYSQDRGHKWLNHLDLWRDVQMPEYPPQVGGGFSYVVSEDAGGLAVVRSTRFEDLPIVAVDGFLGGRSATEIQSRRFGVGYVETATDFEEVRVMRRVFAPDAAARALVSEVELENPGTQSRQYGLVEIWDVNLHDLTVELATSDLLLPNITESIDRRRRRATAAYEHTAEWDAETRTAVLYSRATTLPDEVSDRGSVSERDYFPDPIFLAVLDDAEVDAVWLRDDELYEGLDRGPPPGAARSADASSRRITVPGEGQHALLALRTRLEVPGGERRRVHFAFGYVPGGGSPAAAVTELRDALADAVDSPFAETLAAWRDRLVWAAIPGMPAAGAMQRELAWASYSALANVTFDEYRGVRVLGQGGSYKYVHGVDGAIGDLCLFADAVTLVDPEVAAETLRYALATQQGPAGPTPWRFPYATTGVGAYSDVGVYDQRSDAYWLVPSSVARYVALASDDGLLQQEVSYWPRADGDRGTVVDHLARSMDYALGTLGRGARGLVALGTNDYADGITQLTDEPATPSGASSMFNAALVVMGLPLAADVIDSRDPGLAGSMRDLVAEQRVLYEREGFEGRFYHRGFVDSGAPLAPHLIFLEPQVLPIVAGMVDGDRRRELLDMIGSRLETPLGAVSSAFLMEGGGPDGTGGPDQPQIGGIWPVANAWTTEAYAREDPLLGWDSFVRNSMMAHAEAYPGLWYGIWTGPDSFNNDRHERPGEADVHIATALTDVPAMNAHMHASPLRALMGLLGIEPRADGMRIAPRLPTESFAVRFPVLRLESRPDRFAGSWRAARDREVSLRILLPSGLRGGPVRALVDGEQAPSTVEIGDGGPEIVFPIALRRGAHMAFAVEAAP